MSDPPTYVDFDGHGLNTAGVFCEYDSSTGYCTTSLVVYQSGTGIRRYVQTVQSGPGQYCSGVSNIVDFDGTGLKTTSTGQTPCSAA